MSFSGARVGLSPSDRDYMTHRNRIDGMTDPADHSTDDERIVVGVVDTEGESIDDAEPVFWEARAY